MSIVKGGFAFMLALDSLPGKYAPHLTLAFVGRDLSADVGKAMVNVARTVEIPASIDLTGKFSRFGPKHNVIVALAQPTLELFNLRQALVDGMAKVGVKCNTRHNFTPHVTMPHYCELPETLAVVDLDVKIGSQIVAHIRGGNSR